MSEYPCDNPQCCCNSPIEIDTTNAIEIDFKEVLKYKEKYQSWYLGNSRAILEYYKKNGTKEEIKRRKQIWRYDKSTNRRIQTRAFFRGFKRGFLMIFTGGKTND